MKTRRCTCSLFGGIVLMISLILSFSIVPPACADEKMDSRHLVDKAKMTLEAFTAAPEMEGFRTLIKHAKGVFIVPQVLKGAFLVGGSYGTGVLLSHDAKAGHWAGPAFYTIGEVSWGLQAGGQASEVILLAMTDRGITALLGDSAKLGADVGIAAGPVGAGAAASTANLSGDILAFARSEGLYGGIALDGALVKVRNGLNEAYYGKKKISPTDILVRKTVANPHSNALLEALAGAAEKK